MEAADELRDFDLPGVLEQLASAVLLVACDGRVLFANDRARSLLGDPHPAGRQLSELPRRLLDPDGNPLSREQWPLPRALAAGEAVVVPEVRVERADGSVRTVSVSATPLRGRDGKVLGGVALFEDVGERRAAEKRERLLAAAVASSQDAIIAKTLDGEILSWNRGAEEMYGYRAEEVIGRSITLLAPPERADEIPQLLARLARGERIESLETVRVAKDGRRLCVLLTISPIVDAAGRVMGASTIARDLSEQRRGARERQRLEEELRQAQRLESVGRLAGGIAHEFNNLLQIIDGFGKRLLARAADDETRRELLAIDDATGRASALVKQLLAFGRRQRLQPRPFDLNLLIDDYEPMLRALLGADVVLHCRLELRLPQIAADPAQLEQVLTNLALNARDAMPHGGTLTIETGNVVLDGLEAQAVALAPGEYVLLRVSDTGVGMDEATRERIFEPFFSTRPPTEATGLGLATVYGIVSQSHGAIGVESEPGAGSSFTIYLPKLQPRAHAAPAQRHQDRRNEPAQLLVVEDEPLLLELMTANLREGGYRVLAAGSPRAALELLRDHDVDLIVSDVVMPELNGPELVERARELQPGVPALYVSGYADQALSRGARHEPLLHKPFDPDDLLAAVAALLRATRQSRIA